MIEHMHEKLLRWADWSSRGGLAPGLWYARCTFGNEGGGGQVVDPVIDMMIYELDKAVTRLPDELNRTVLVYYLGTGTMRQKARECRVCEKTMYLRLHHAQERLVRMLDEATRKERAWPVKSSLAGS